MGDDNAALFLEKFELLKDETETAVKLSALSDVSLINAKNKNIFDSSKLEDHHALIPLDKLPAGADTKERNVYLIVLESFFTVCMPDFVYNEKSFCFHIDKYLFKAKVREVVKAGWKAAKQMNDDELDDAQTVKEFDESNCRAAELNILNKKTEPKKEFSLDTLLSFMEKPRDNVPQPADVHQRFPIMPP